MCPFARMPFGTLMGFVAMISLSGGMLARFATRFERIRTLFGAAAPAAEQ